MKKIVSLFVISTVLTLSTLAQSIQEGINHLYAERNVSAKTNFERMLASNPNNIEASYWLGQTFLAVDNITAVRQHYEKSLGTSGNAPLLLVGMGHVELMEGKTAEARQRFETAISMSRGKKGDDANVLNAIGRANVDGKNGDIAYAIAKLTAASQAAPNNADIFINLGNAFRKAKDGGQAVTAYIKAAQANPSLAIPYYRMARIYETQRNWDVFNENLNKSITIDPKFAPALSSQYNYNLLYKQDFAAASALANKIIAVSDPSIQNDYYKAQAEFLQKKYDNAINIAKTIASQAGNETRPAVYRLLAYSYLAKGDTATGKQYVDQLFSRAKREDRVGPDYTLKATIYSKDYPDQVLQIYMDAADEDTSLRNKMVILGEALDWAKTGSRKIPEGDIRLAMYKLNPNSNPAALFQIGLPFYQGKSFPRADSIFQAYSRAFPDSVFGYLWSARSLASIDTSMSQGLAIPQYEQVIRVASMDKVRYRSYGIEASGQLANYYVNVKGEKEKGIEYLNKGLEFDPENAAFKSAVQRLKAPVKTTPPKTTTPAKGKTKTSTSANQAKTPVKKKG
jgi:Tfp pilus assembly protein PilF